MEILYASIKAVHILAGSAALFCGLLAIIFRHKIKAHKPFGRIYFWGMTVIFVSSVIMSTWRTNLFFFCLSFFSYYSCLVAYRALRLKKLHAEQSPEWYDWGIEIFFGLMHVGFVVLGLSMLKSNLSFGIISSVFGVIGLRQNYDSVKRLRRKLEYRNYWLLAHIGGMLGSYIGAITAFLVNNNRWIHLPDLVIWLGPACLILPFMIIEIKKHQKKAGRFSVGVETNKV